MLERSCSRSGFLNQCGVLLGVAVQVLNALANLVHAHGLLLRCGGDFAEVGIDLLRIDHHVAHGLPGCLHHTGTSGNLLDTGGDQPFDFLGRTGTALRQRSHLAGHHGKPTASLTCTGCLNRGIQCQDVGLKGNAVDHTNDVVDF